MFEIAIEWSVWVCLFMCLELLTPIKFGYWVSIPDVNLFFIDRLYWKLGQYPRFKFGYWVSIPDLNLVFIDRL